MHCVPFLNDILSVSYFVFVLCINFIYKFPLWQARARLLSLCVSLTLALLNSDLHCIVTLNTDLHFV